VSLRLVSQNEVGASYGPAADPFNRERPEFRPGQTRMARPKIQPSTATVAPERGVKAATFHLLLDTPRWR
jgi:hypothetical protein